MTTTTTSMLLTALLLAAPACRTVPRTTARALGPEAERDVWSAVVQQVYARPGTAVAVLEPWIDRSAAQESIGRPPGVSSAHWTALRAANARARRLPADLDVGLPIEWFGHADWMDLPDDRSIESRWTAFHERFPDNTGHVSLSGVGFSRDGRTALVYGFVGSASLSASGDFFVLRRDGDGWTVVRTINMVMA